MQIIPTILEKNFSEAQRKILIVKDFSKWIQLDVVDGCFTYGKTFELELINKINQVENILWDVHLMVKEPKNWINKCGYISACRIIGQVEMMSDKNFFINKTKDMGFEAGLAYDIDTDIKDIPKETDLVLLLGRQAGFKPYLFDNKVFEKIDKLKKIKIKEKLKFEIGVDGGVGEKNIGQLSNQGVNITYCGTAVFNGNVENNIKKLEYASKN